MPQVDSQQVDTRSRILASARSHFAERGFDGARTQAIADDAGVNKAMLYYHFQDKEHIYTETLATLFGALFQRIIPVLMNRDLPARDRILAVVSIYQQFLLENPDIRSLILRELAAGGTHMKIILRKQLEDITGAKVEMVFDQIQGMIDSGQIRPGDPRHVFLHIISLVIFPFAARPLLEAIWELTPEQYDALMRSRIEVITDLLDRGLFTGKEDR